MRIFLFCIWKLEKSVVHIQKVQDYASDSFFTRKQFPLVLSCASTIHKVQRLTLSFVPIFFSDMISHGQLYVALSRVRKGEDIYIFGINAGDLERRFRMLVNCDDIELTDIWVFMIYF